MCCVITKRGLIPPSQFTERNWNMWIPGFGTDELRPYKRSSVTEAHKQRLALIRKTLKKY